MSKTAQTLARIDESTTVNDITAMVGLLRRVDSKDATPEDVEEFRHLLDALPGLWQAFGDFVQVSLRQLLADSTTTEAVRESVRHGVSIQRRDLGYDKASALEKLLIDQVLISWVVLFKTQSYYAVITRSSTDIPQLDYWEHRLSSAQARHMRALETLACVRRLSHPRAVQVNIGGQQVNVASMQSQNAPK